MNDGPDGDGEDPEGAETAVVSEVSSASEVSSVSEVSSASEVSSVSEMSDADPGSASFAAAQSRRMTWGGGSQLDQLMPVLLFLVFYNLDRVQVAGLSNIEVAVIAATAWSIKAACSRLRRGLPIGKWLPAITGYLVVRAAFSIAVERELVDFGVSSEAVYFGIGIGTKTLVGLAAVATIIVGKPFALWAVRFVPDLPEALRNDRRFVATLRDVTWVVAFYEIGSSVWDTWLYNNSGVTSFVIIRYLGNYVASFVLIFATFIYMERRFSRIEGCPSLVELVSRMTRRSPATSP